MRATIVIPALLAAIIYAPPGERMRREPLPPWPQPPRKRQFSPPPAPVVVLLMVPPLAPLPPWQIVLESECCFYDDQSIPINLDVTAHLGPATGLWRAQLFGGPEVRVPRGFRREGGKMRVSSRSRVFPLPSVPRAA